MKAKWHFKDLIDLEYFLHQAGGRNTAASPASLSGDREIFLDFKKSNPSPHTLRDLLKYWVDRQRENIKHDRKASASSPGETFYESFRIIRIILILFSLIVGAALEEEFEHSAHWTDQIILDEDNVIRPRYSSLEEVEVELLRRFRGGSVGAT